MAEQALKPALPEKLFEIVGRLASLPSASVMKLSPEEATLAAHDQVEALADLPADLVDTARRRAMKSCRFAPAPVEIIDQVRDEIEERRTARHILKVLIRMAREP